MRQNLKLKISNFDPCLGYPSIASEVFFCPFNEKVREGGLLHIPPLGVCPKNRDVVILPNVTL